mgnify:FL=1
MTAREPPVNYDTRIAPLRSSSRNSTNIRNPLIYYVNRNIKRYHILYPACDANAIRFHLQNL